MGPMLYRQPDLRGFRGRDGETTIDPTERAPRIRAWPASPAADWPVVAAWAEDLVARISAEQTAQHVAIFVPDDDGSGLRLAAQIWGAGEDTGEVVAGHWVIPLEGSVCGRVYRTGMATLCADIAMDPDYRGYPGGRTRSSLTVPIGPPNDVIAVINLEAPWISAFSIRDYERITERAVVAYETFPERSAA